MKGIIRGPLTLAILLAAGFWVADAVIGTLLSPGATFWDRFLLDVPPHNLATRLLGVMMATGVGLYVRRAPARQEQLPSDEARAGGPESEQVLLESSFVREQLMLAEAIADMTLVLSSQTERERIYEEILEQAAKLVRLDAANIMILENGTLRMAGWSGYDAFCDSEWIQNLRQSLEQFPLANQAIRRREPLYIADTLDNPDWVWLSESEWIRSHLAVPIARGDAVLGVLRVDRRDPGAFSPSDARRLGVLASTAAIALENARLYELTQQEINERREAEARILEHEARLRHLTEQLPIAVWSLDSDLRIRHQFGAVTRVGDRILQNREQVIGQHVYDFWREIAGEEMAQQRMMVLTRALAGETARLAYQLDDRYIEDIMSSLRDSEGKTIGIVGVASDVTERVKSENALRASERRLQHILAQLPVALWSTNADLRLTYFSSSLQAPETYLARRSEFIGKTSAEFLSETLPPDVVRRREEYWQQALAGETVHYETLLFDRWIEDTLSPLRDESGAIVGTVGLAVDVTERVSAAQALRDSESRLQHMIQQLPLALWSTDADLRVTSFSSSLRADESYVKRRPAFVGKTLREIHRETLPEEKVQERFRYCQRALAGETVHYETLFFDRWIADTLSPLRDESGSIVGTVGVAIDVTERKRMEKERLRHEKLESLSILAGNVAHDFNNYLTAILTHLALTHQHLAAGTDPEHVLSEAEKASLRAQALTHQLLTFAKDEEPVRAVASIEGTLRDAASFSLVGSRAECHVQIDDGLWPIECDEGLVSQAFSNIVLNAVQAMPEGGQIAIVAENVQLGTDSPLPLPAGDYVHISVTDDGTGILDEDLSRVFDPFFTTKTGGSGLGLPSAHSIISQHDGHIAVQTAIGEGTTFHIYLPASAEPAVSRTDDEGKVAACAGKILIMEDDDMLRLALQMMLETIGCESESAADGKEAIDLYANALEAGAPFDAVLMDLTVERGMGGAEATREIRRLDADARIIVSSGYADDPIVASPHDHGFCGVVTKPFELRKLSSALHSAMTK